METGKPGASLSLQPAAQGSVPTEDHTGDSGQVSPLPWL